MALAWANRKFLGRWSNRWAVSEVHWTLRGRHFQRPLESVSARTSLGRTGQTGFGRDATSRRVGEVDTPSFMYRLSHVGVIDPGAASFGYSRHLHHGGCRRVLRRARCVKKSGCAPHGGR